MVRSEDEIPESNAERFLFLYAWVPDRNNHFPHITSYFETPGILC